MNKAYIQSVPLTDDQPYIVQIAENNSLAEVNENEISLPPLTYNPTTIPDAPSWVKPGAKCTLYVKSLTPTPL